MTKNMTVRLPDELAADAEALARAEGQSVNETVKQALAEAVERRRKDPAFRAAAQGHRRGSGVARAPGEVTVEYLDLADFVAIAAEVTGLDTATVMKLASLDLADSALHAPAAGFGDTEFYPDFIDKAAVLIVRLAKNHPLPDGNKRVAWVSLRLFVEINGWSWAERPSVDEAERVVLAIAAGEWDEERVANWLREKLVDEPPP